MLSNISNPDAYGTAFLIFSFSQNISQNAAYLSKYGAAFVAYSLQLLSVFTLKMLLTFGAFFIYQKDGLVTFFFSMDTLYKYFGIKHFIIFYS